MPREISVDENRCIGSANCQFWAEGVFDLDDDNVAYVVDPEAQPLDKIVGAAEGCPTGAIAVVEDGQTLAGS